MSEEHATPPEDNSGFTADLKTMIKEIYDYIIELKKDYDKFVADVRLDRHSVQELLGVSEATVGRWRAKKLLPYYINDSRNSYYLFDDVYVACKRGQLDIRGFDRIAALKRLNAFKNGLLFQARSGYASGE